MCFHQLSKADPLAKEFVSQILRNKKIDPATKTLLFSYTLNFSLTNLDWFSELCKNYEIPESQVRSLRIPDYKDTKNYWEILVHLVVSVPVDKKDTWKETIFFPRLIIVEERQCKKPHPRVGFSLFGFWLFATFPNVYAYALAGLEARIDSEMSKIIAWAQAFDGEENQEWKELFLDHLRAFQRSLLEKMFCERKPNISETKQFFDEMYRNISSITVGKTKQSLMENPLSDFDRQVIAKIASFHQDYHQIKSR